MLHKGINLAFSIIIFLVAQTNVFAQEKGLSFEHVTVDDGLTQNSIFSIAEDSRGYMWFGTTLGLNKFDSRNISKYKIPPSATGNIIQSGFTTDLFTDSHNTLWASTLDGLLEYIPATNTFKKHISFSGRSLSSNQIRCLYEDKNGPLWLGTSNGINLLSVTRGQKSINIKQILLKGKDVLCIYKDSKENIWIGTTKGLYKCSYVDKRLKFTFYLALSDIIIQNIAEDNYGNLWVGTKGKGLFQLNSKTNNLLSFTHKEDDKTSIVSNNIRKIMVHKTSGELWLGTFEGLSIFNPKNQKSVSYQNDPDNPNSLNQNSIYEVFQDSHENVWIGTYFGGVNVVYSHSTPFHVLKKSSTINSLSSNVISYIHEDEKGNLWVGTEAGGLNFLDRQTGKFTSYKNNNKNSSSLGSNLVKWIHEDKDNDIWVASHLGGLGLFHPQTKSFTSYKRNPHDPYSIPSDKVTSILMDSKNRFWVGTEDEGLTLFDKKTGRFTPCSKIPSLGFSSKSIRCIFEDSQKNLLVGTASGLFCLSKGSSKFKLVSGTAAKNLKSIIVNCIQSDRRKNIWLGVMEGGLIKLELNSGAVTKYNINHGLADNNVLGILEDTQGVLWLSTNRGLTKFNPSTLAVKNYTSRDGLPENFNYNSFLKTRDNEFLFGSFNGLVRFSPKQIRSNLSPPKITLTGLTLFGKPVKINDTTGILNKDISLARSLNLTYKQNVISLEFAALNFIKSDKNKFAYRLEGLEKDWNYVDIPSASYNLNPGKYRLYIKAANNDGAWNEAGSWLDITVAPPFWLTWWFKLITALSIVGGAFLFYFIRINNIKRQKVILENLVELRTAEVTQQSEELKVQAENLQDLNEELQVQSEELKSQADNLQDLNEELQAQSEEMQSQAENLKILNTNLELQKEQEHLLREDAEASRMEADKANQAKSVFLATMSHEIRTPMNGVIGMAALLSQTPLNSEQEDYVNVINTSGDALLHVINDILDFSKIESGNLELEIQDFDLRSCIESVIDVFTNKAAQQNLDLVYQINHQIPEMITGDSHRLRQILINFVSNAMKFTKQGEVFIEVNLINNSNNKLEIGFNVHDSGIGIPEDKLSRLFKAFSQVDSSTTRKYGGTGLGLVISERLVGLMGGEVSVSSKVGVGSIFSFSIQSSAANATVGTGEFVPTIEWEGKKVLIVDDNRTSLNVLKTQFELWKLVPVLASSGKQALEMLQEHKLDLVISDLQMPEVNGVELCTQIKNSYPYIPLILLTSAGDNCKANHPGLFNAILNKPIKQANLLNAVQGQLRQAGEPVLSVVKNDIILSEEFAKLYPLDILIAEDNLINQKLALKVLSKLGYDAKLANNGKEAVEMFELHPYQVVLMDMLMPEMDGLTATKVIRKSSQPQPAIIAMTANVLPEDKEACFNAGMNGFISKPFKLEALTELLIETSNKLRVLITT
ncbi:MAG: response regulator [Sphingobacteriaceae bacterium]|nr:response regulator [Sphingobacteriaceae bacterium]